MLPSYQTYYLHQSHYIHQTHQIYQTYLELDWTVWSPLLL